MKPIEIFRAGTHTAMSGDQVTITTADLAACAAAYDIALHEAPIVVGHPATNMPAYGWASGLTVDGDRLIATPGQVDPQFAEMVQAGRFKKRSASFYRPADPANPKPGTWYLKHIGFLGAQPPSVKGLKEVDFAAAGQGLEFADWQGLRVAGILSRMRDWLIAQSGLEKADAVISADDLDALRFEASQPDCPDDDADDMPAQSFSQGDDVTDAEKAALAADKAKLATEQAAFAEKQKVARRNQLGVFVDGLIAAGKLATGHRAPLIAFMETIPAGDGGTFEFAEAAAAGATPKVVKTDATEWFQGFLNGLKPLVPLGEAAAHKPGESFAEGVPAGLDPGKVYEKYNQTKKA